MSVALLELAAAALGDLAGEVVFTGGATVGLWITDSAASEPRPTKDVDVIVDDASQARAERIVIPRIDAIVTARP